VRRLYANLRLTAFDRLHLFTGFRWSRYEFSSSISNLCTSIPATGTPAANNCVGRQIGDALAPTNRQFNGNNFSWPPAATLSFDLTKRLNLYVSYTDIYQSQATYLNGDLNPIDPITGSNWEAGVKWEARDGRLNISLAGFKIEQKGFPAEDGTYDFTVTPDDTAKGIFYYFVASNGRRVQNAQVGSDSFCCYKNDPNLTYKSEGIDFELTGEIIPGLQVAASYTYNQTKQVGSSLGAGAGLPYVSIQPEHNYKLWSSFDFGASGRKNWLSGLTLSGGVIGRSSSFYAGTTCKLDFIVTDATTGVATCPNKNGVSGNAPYSFTVDGYAVFSGRLDYRFSDKWALAINIDNILDKTYYQTVGSAPQSGNWYGAPRSVTATLRAKW
jgi:outer membrane receptor for ferric coprogen and ferric-rhodotorulic acid